MLEGCIDEYWRPNHDFSKIRRRPDTLFFAVSAFATWAQTVEHNDFQLFLKDRDRMNGPRVVELQKVLMAFGYDLGADGADDSPSWKRISTPTPVT